MQKATLKTSTIFIAKGGEANSTQVYRSVEDVPADLRRELEASTNGFNSATILIADRRGRQEILRALQGLPSDLRTRLAASLAARQAQAAPTAQTPLGSAVIGKRRIEHMVVRRSMPRGWMQILLPGAVALGLWLAMRF